MNNSEIIMDIYENMNGDEYFKNATLRFLTDLFNITDESDNIYSSALKNVWKVKNELNILNGAFATIKVLVTIELERRVSIEE